MAISLTSDGLRLNYPTSAQNSAGSHPVGCVVVFKPSSVFTLNGTWVTIAMPGGINVGVSTSINATNFGIRVN